MNQRPCTNITTMAAAGGNCPLAPHERVGEERDSGAKREVARQQPAWGVVDGDDYDDDDDKGSGQDKDDDNG